MTTSPSTRRLHLSRRIALLLSLAAGLVSVAPGVATAAQPPLGSAALSTEVGASMGSAGYSTTDAEALLAVEFLRQLNAERAARGIAPVEVRTDLVTASTEWSDRMATRVGLTHSSDGRAEIIGYGYRSGQITEAFMDSPSHRAVIVDPNLVAAGVGVACDGGDRIWVTVQFVRADRSLPVRTSSPASPQVIPRSQGSNCAALSSNASPIRRLYQAYFLRESDIGGLAFWTTAEANGMSLGEISEHFARSSEFVQRYGSLSDREFVRRVYLNVMGRQPDEAGYDFWIGQLRAGLTRGEMMIGFSESVEFRGLSGIA
ncbi:MAG: DUF4214 domain-containing protein [Acidimicrobiales bacterium]